MQTIVEILAKRALLDHRQQIAVRRRHQADVGAQRARGAEALEGVLLQHAQELGLQLEGEVADFIEEQRPPLASSKRPRRCVMAPVNAPFSCPNSSLSSSPVGMAAQLSVTKGACAAALRWCSARASSSLPVPVSP